MPKWQLRRLWFALFGLMLFTASSVPLAYRVSLGQATPQAAPPLFSAGLTAATSDDLPPALLRQRVVTVDFPLLAAATTASTESQAHATDRELTLNFFSDATFTVRLQHQTPLVDGGASWVGRVVDRPLSDVVMIVRDQMVTANLYTDQGLFQLRALGDGQHQVQQVDPTQLPHSHDDGPPAPPATEEDLLRAAATTDNGSLIDIMILYAPNARVAAGGKAAIEARIDLAVAQTNQIYANSRINPRLRLVYAGEVNYNTAGSQRTDLERLTGTSDGYLDEIHALRDRYGADLVNLWVEGGDLCGIGWVRSQATSAFSVVARACAEGGVTLAHEIGHNFGARHDWFVDGYVDTPSYNKGYVNLAGGWITVMAYFDQCVAAGVNCRPVLYFSNPDLLLNGAPLGVRAGTSTACRTGNLANPACDAENYRVHNERAVTVANFRPGYTYADLIVEQRDLADPVRAGAEVTYQVTVSNVGAQVATNVSLTDQLPSGVRFVRAVNPNGSCTLSGNNVTCGLGTLPVRSSVIVTIVVATDGQTPALIANVATVTTASQEERTTNNSSREETLVRSPTGNNILFVSTAGNGRLGNLAYGDEDLLAYNLYTGDWQLIFDGSDVGITTDIDGFAWRRDGTLLLSFDKPTAVNGVGTVADSDIVRFVPSQLGSTTRGTFALFLDGSTVDLTTTGEDIDAIALTPAGELVISTLSTAKVGPLVVPDADLLVLRNGRWELYFDGSRADLTSTTEDISGAWIDPQTGAIYLSTEGSFIIPGVSGRGGDIFSCLASGLGNGTACRYSLFWRTGEANISSAMIDGIDLGGLPSGVTITAAGPLDLPEEQLAEEEDPVAAPENLDSHRRSERIFLPLISN